jgi:hypothetical protein
MSSALFGVGSGAAAMPFLPGGTEPFDLNSSLVVAAVSACAFAAMHAVAHAVLYRIHVASASRGGSAAGAATTAVKLSLGSAASKASPSAAYDPDFGARVVSWVHSVVSTVASAYALYAHARAGGWFDSPTTRLESWAQAISFAYFSVDLVFTVFFAWDPLFFFHHVISMASLVCGSFFGIYGFVVCAALLAGEVSNPFMHTRWLLNASGLRHTTMCRVATALWFPTFFIARVVVSPWIAYYAVQVMHWSYWPQVFLMIVFSVKFIVDAARAEMAGEWWSG